MTCEETNTPIDIALLVAHKETDEISQSYQLKEIAVIMACEGEFSEAVLLCDEIHFTEARLEALLEISREMLKQGQHKVAWKTVRAIIKICREQESYFPHEILLEYLDCFLKAGKEKLVRYILALALLHVHQLKSDGYQLQCFVKILKSLVIYWREKAEELIDYLLDLPLCDMPREEGFAKYNCLTELCDMALLIRTYDLNWSEERQLRFLSFLLLLDCQETN